jgi:peptidyl-prolyl cis-trans isomerase D
MSATFRRLSKSMVGKIVAVLFLLAILASFALADVQSYITGGLANPGTLADVGDETITERELSAAMQRRMSQDRQQNPEADY